MEDKLTQRILLIVLLSIIFFLANIIIELIDAHIKIELAKYNLYHRQEIEKYRINRYEVHRPKY